VGRQIHLLGSDKDRGWQEKTRGGHGTGTVQTPHSTSDYFDVILALAQPATLALGA